MLVHFTLRGGVAKAAFLGLALSFSGALVALAWAHFIVRALSDERYVVQAEFLSAAVALFPSSPRLNARLGGAELSAALTGSDNEAALHRAADAANAAVKLSPWDYRYRLTQAEILEAAGDAAGAEAALHKAAALAPAVTDVRWRLANILVRNGRTEAALAEFRTVAGQSASLLPAVVDAAWTATGGDPAAVKSLAGGSPEGRIAVARYLSRRGSADEAVKVLGGINAEAARSSGALLSEMSKVVDDLLAAGSASAARALWARLAGRAEDGIVWDGGFESETPDGLPQFAWRLKSSGYARVGPAPVARGGERSLRVEFTGRDTTRLEQEATQLIVVRPGGRYRLEAYAAAEALVTTEGPRLAVVHGQTVVAETQAVGPAISGWQRLAADFTAPPGADTLTIAVRRIPRFAFDEPTHGAVVFDDVSVAELTRAK
jgi:tetratricopeptide (TPR) repeat protein